MMSEEEAGCLRLLEKYMHYPRIPVSALQNKYEQYPEWMADDEGLVCVRTG